MGRTTVAVTKHLLAQVLRLPAGVQIVGARECPYDHSVDLVLEGDQVPDADRCHARVTGFKYEFEPVATAKEKT